MNLFFQEERLNLRLSHEEKNQLFKRAKQLIQKEVTDKTIKSELNDFRNKITKLINKEKTKLRHRLRKQNAKIEVKYSYSNTGSAYAYIKVNGRDLPASKWAIKKLYYYFYKLSMGYPYIV